MRLALHEAQWWWEREYNLDVGTLGLLLLLIRPQVDFQAVSAKMGTTVAAAKSRLNRVKDRMEFLMKSKEAIKNAKPGPASPSKPAEQDEEEPKPEKSYIDELAEDL